ncbi:MAG TPA: hypothetical protein VM491_14390 [Burkholderiaceae bacterium]|nr:hypothetical protein [Burkholderiaceae bacterium]
MSVLLSAQSGFELLAAIRDTARLSVVIARPSTHRTVQIKGNGAGVVVPAEPRYRELLRKRRDAFLREVAGYGFTERFVDAWYAVRPEQLACVTFAPYGAWDQTPGPGAGRPIELLP